MKFNGTVLLVDDELHIRKYVGLILKKLGVQTILEASNGEEALAIFEREKPEVVLLDVNMPFMGGLEVLKKIKEIDANCAVIMLTSLANRETVEETLALGAAGYVRKDTPKEEIANALAEIIDSCFEQESDPPAR